MIVFIAGMQRSGSTFSFNIAREILLARGSVYQEPHPSIYSVIERSGNADHVILKAHAVDDFTCRMAQLGTLKVVCTVRKPEDAIASWIETFGFSLEDSIGRMRDWIEMFGRLKDHALIVDYDEIDLRPYKAGRRIARYISPDAGYFEIRRAVKRNTKAVVKEATDRIANEGDEVTDIGFSYYHSATFLHRRHVSSLVSRGAAERISAESVITIRRELSDLLDHDGHLVWSRLPAPTPSPTRGAAPP